MVREISRARLESRRAAPTPIIRICLRCQQKCPSGCFLFFLVQAIQDPVEGLLFFTGYDVLVLDASYASEIPVAAGADLTKVN